MLEQKNNIESKNEENIITNKSGTNTNILSVLRAKRTTKKHTKKEMNNIIDDKFEFFPHIPLGNGAFSTVFASRDLTDTNKLYAIKFENSLLSNKLKLEKDIYDIMYGAEGFPIVYTYGTTKTSNYLVMDRLGPSLKELFGYCNFHFSLQTICLIAIQALTRIHDLHFKSGYIYNDIKPDNFLIGLNQTNMIYLIDMGNAKPFRIYNFTTNKVEHIPYKDNISPITNITRFSSINHQMGIETSRRDDLESLGYMLIYFANGSLPWKGGSKSNSEDKFNQMLEKKMSIPIEVYCKELPIEFSIYMSYVQNLRFNEKPDYNYLKNLFAKLLFGSYIKKFFFDWNIAQPKEVPSNLRVNKELDNKYLFKKIKEKKKEKKVTSNAVIKMIKIGNDNTEEDDSSKQKEEYESSDKENKESEEEEESASSISSSNVNNNQSNNVEMIKENDEEKLKDSSELISDNNNDRLNTEENKDSDESHSDKTEHNSTFNDEDFLSMFTDLNAPRKKIVAPTYKPSEKSNIIIRSSNVNTTQNNNTNDDLLTKSNRSGFSLNSINSESHSLLNKNKKIPQLGNLRLLNKGMINEVDEDNATSKRDYK